MRIFNRGQRIRFTHTFYDSSGELTSPTTATLYISFPTSGWPYRGVMESTYLSMVQSTAASTSDGYLTWSTTWASATAYPGPVYWHIRADDLTLSVADGELTLRGNPANLSVTSTT